MIRYALGGAFIFAVVSGAALGAAVGWVIRHGISDQDEKLPAPERLG